MKEDETLYEKTIRQLKNNKGVVIILLAFTILVSVVKESQDILNLVFLVQPGLKPTVPVVSNKRDVTLSDLQVDPIPNWSVTLKEGEQEAIAAVHFKAQIEGYENKPLAVKWNVYIGDTGDIYSHQAGAPPLGLSAGDLGPFIGTPTSGFTATVASQSFLGEIHVPIDYQLPQRRRGDPITFRVRIGVYDSSGNPLAQKDTLLFTVPDWKPAP